MAKVKVLSVRTESRPGALADLVGLLADKEINLLSICANETVGVSEIKVLAEDPAKAMRALERGGYAAYFEEALAVAVPNKTGAFRDLLARFAAAGLNVRYAYFACETSAKTGLVVLSVSDTSGALRVLGKEG
jgi:hypothetical protein